LQDWIDCGNSWTAVQLRGAAGRMRGKFWLYVSGLLALAYTVYVVWAKLAKVIGPPPIKLGEVGEFLFFFSIIVAFSLQVIVEERRKLGRGDGASS
jgi:hypothetical protein